eukprot:3687849-Rhodomonas_salina.3
MQHKHCEVGTYAVPVGVGDENARGASTCTHEIAENFRNFDKLDRTMSTSAARSAPDTRGSRV